MLKRAKVIKDLILGKLDDINFSVESAIRKLQNLEERLGQNVGDGIGNLNPHQNVLPSQIPRYLDSKQEMWPWNYKPLDFPSELPSGKPWPKISIVTPSYNQGKYIEETIRSVLMQGYPNLEYIVIDGASTDETLKIIHRYSSELKVCLSEPDGGQAHAINKGFKYATGDILAWLNSDDQYLPGALFRVAEAFDQHSTDLVVGGCQVIHECDRLPILEHHCIFPVNQVVELPLEQLRDFEGCWLKGHFFYQPEVFWTREAWEAAGGALNEKLQFALDYEFWLRLAKLRTKICHIQDNLAIFRRHERQKTIFAREVELFPEYTKISREFASIEPSIPESTIPKDRFTDNPIKYYITPIGNYFLPANATRDAIAKCMREGEIFEPKIVETASRYITPGSTVLDIGANFGQMSLLFSQLCGDEGLVLAFEADDYVFDILLKNIDVNQAWNVRAFLGAVYNTDHEEVIYPIPDFKEFSSYGSYGLDPSAKSGRKIETITVDSLKIQSPISFMKVDVQGSDLFALQGAMETIKKHRMPILFEYEEQFQEHFKTSFQDYLDFLESISYRIEKTIYSINYLAIPDARKVAFSISKPQTAQEVSKSSEFSQLGANPKLPNPRLCQFLKSKDEVDVCTKFLHRNGYVSHNLTCKDWDIAHIVPEIGDGNFLDMGSSDSYILKNVALKGLRGERFGIDFQEPDVPVKGVTYIRGDLMATGLPNNHFRYVTCLSVLEHQVDYDKFASEVSRLLEVGGKLFVTFDYWDPKLIPPVKLYGLEWQPLDAELLRDFITACEKKSLYLIQEMDWTTGDAVIRHGYYSPHPEMNYTFGLVTFEKR